MSTANTPTTPKTPTPPTVPTKLCHIVKRVDFDGYGFNLHSEKLKPGQFIGKVDAGSPAEQAGLKEGDRILEVNGVSIGSETHKQVVARIKAIANEVRLLLIDVDGKGDANKNAASTKTANGNSNGNNNSNNSNGNAIESNCEGTKQEIPGASANISSISMVSTKRISNASSNQSSSTLNADVVDKAVPASVSLQQNGTSVHEVSATAAADDEHLNAKVNALNISNNAILNNTTTPPPPSAAVTMHNNNGNVYHTSATLATPNINGNSHNHMTAETNNNASVNRAGSLNLPLTAAEMRAKLASKKKYDPKNETVDLKKKFDIIQKL